MSILGTIHQRAANSGFEVQHEFADDTGPFGFLLERDGQRYAIVGKSYSYQNLASFMRVVVDLAADNGWYLLFYEDKEGTTTLFDADYVQANGRPSSGDSKKKFTEWIEIDRDYGVRLGDHLHRGETPTTLAGDNSTLGNYA